MQRLLHLLMKKTLLVLSAAVALASCREASTAVQSQPSAAGTAAKVLRLDTTFLKTAGARTYAHTYTGKLLVGQTKKVALPVQIDWTTTEQGGCSQVAAVRVYQLNGNDRRTTLMARAMRDAVCKPGSRADGAARPLGKAPAYTGSAYLKLMGESREIRQTTTVLFTLNGLGYHDTLDGDSTAAASAAQ